MPYFVQNGAIRSRTRKYQILVPCYTVQNYRVAERLERGLIHYQPWLLSAAYTGTPEDPDGLAHRRAYLWMASQFKERKQRRLKHAPVWLTFSVMNCTVKSDLERVLYLLIPKSEILISTYYADDDRSWERVLHNEPCGNVEWATRADRRKATRLSWESLFDDLPGLLGRQGIVDRLDPAWLCGMTTCDECLQRAALRFEAAPAQAKSALRDAYLLI